MTVCLRFPFVTSTVSLAFLFHTHWPRRFCYCSPRIPDVISTTLLAQASGAIQPDFLNCPPTPLGSRWPYTLDSQSSETESVSDWRSPTSTRAGSGAALHPGPGQQAPICTSRRPQGERCSCCFSGSSHCTCVSSWRTVVVDQSPMRCTCGLQCHLSGDFPGSLSVSRRGRKT